MNQKFFPCNRSEYTIGRIASKRMVMQQNTKRWTAVYPIVTRRKNNQRWLPEAECHFASF